MEAGFYANCGARFLNKLEGESLSKMSESNLEKLTALCRGVSPVGLEAVIEARCPAERCGAKFRLMTLGDEVTVLDIETFGEQPCVR
jgi:hypothetical protein